MTEHINLESNFFFFHSNSQTNNIKLIDYNGPNCFFYL